MQVRFSFLMITDVPRLLPWGKGVGVLNIVTKKVTEDTAANSRAAWLTFDQLFADLKALGGVRRSPLSTTRTSLLLITNVTTSKDMDSGLASGHSGFYKLFFKMNGKLNILKVHKICIRKYAHLSPNSKYIPRYSHLKFMNLANSNSTRWHASNLTQILACVVFE